MEEKNQIPMFTRIYYAAFVILLTCIAILTIVIANNSFYAVKELHEIYTLLAEPI